MQRTELKEYSDAVHAAFPQHGQYIQDVLRHKQLTHAYAVVGSGAAGGQRSIAEWMAAQILLQDIASEDTAERQRMYAQISNGTHPDMTVVQPEKSESRISVEQVRTVQQALSSRPSIASTSVVLIHDAERVTVQAANALLKWLEEPASDTVVILSTPYPYQLPATVRSRVQMLFLPVVPHERSRQVIERSGHQSAVSGAGQEELIHLAGGRFDTLLKLLDNSATESSDESSSAEGKSLVIESKEQLLFWDRFLQVDTAERKNMLEQTYLKGGKSKAEKAESTHQLREALETLELVIHDLLLEQYGLTHTALLTVRQGTDPGVTFTPRQLWVRLRLVTRLKEMAQSHVNKQSLFEYLITGM